MGSTTPQPIPSLQVNEIQDVLIRKNFQNLVSYFAGQNQLLNFNFLELVFTGAVTAQPIAHNQGVIPQDIIVTKVTGTGTVTFLHGQFTNTKMFVTTTGACRVRFFYGTYFNFTSSVSNSSSDSSAYSGTNVSTTFFQSGMMLYWPTATPPPGFLLYVDTVLSQATYPNLFTIFGTKYQQAGDAAGTFRLPPGVARTVVIAGNSPLSVTGTNSSTPTAKTFGSFSGEEKHTLSAVESGLPGHTHVLTDPGHTHTITDPSHNHTQNAHNHDAHYFVGASNTGSSSAFFATGNNNNTAANQISLGGFTVQSSTAVNQAAVTGITGTNSNTTGITIAAAAAAAAASSHNNLQPYTVWYAIIKT